MTEKMTAEQATTFENGYSTASILIVTQALQERGCDCQPYTDTFTYNRWKAQGMQVQKGEHGIKLMTYIPVTKETDDGKTEVTHTRPWSTTVFCRHQVKPIKES